jgi:FkbM family methyltransferase
MPMNPPYVSYAQHGEDVLLHRALSGVDDGFYIDVGAHDPEHLSVTKAFYDRGWRGINLEPAASCFKRLLAQRPRDINLRILASDREGASEFYEVRDSGLSTEDPQLASLHEKSGFAVSRTTLDSRTLDAVCEEHVRGEIHFLKVDVEGAEERVLRGLALRRHRPWVIVVEATEPLATDRSDRQLAGYLGARDYRHVYFDGLNSFFVAAEHERLAKFFDRPANPLDGYLLPAHVELQALRERLAAYEALASWRVMRLEDRLRKVWRALRGRA